MTPWAEAEAAGITAPITILVMGCTANGISEAPNPDLGVCCYQGGGQIFVRGEKAATVP